MTTPRTTARSARQGRRHGAGLVAAALTALLVLGACADPEPPQVPVGPDGQPDPQLVLGRDVWGANCATCHGPEGEGGRGNRINDGRSVEKYPDVADQIAVVVNGKGNGMPAWVDRLTPAEIEAVVAYTREVL